MVQSSLQNAAGDGYPLFRCFGDAVFIQRQTHHGRAVLLHNRQHTLQNLRLSVDRVHRSLAVIDPQPCLQCVRVGGIELKRHSDRALQLLYHSGQHNHFIHTGEAYVHIQDVRSGILLLDTHIQDIVQVIFQQRLLETLKGQANVTKDGKTIRIYCNIGSPDYVANALDHDCEAIGLFRSEFLFMDSAELPSEEEQFNAYRKVASALKGAPVIIRTLDVGGDKEIPYLHMVKEDNPFMGFRAVRYCLANPDQYKVQLRALLRASAFGDVKIMIPLVTCVEEVVAVKELVEQCKAELTEEGRKFNENIEVGIMVETPAASLLADRLAEVADFFSIGTNDLIGYTMCADRGNDTISNLYQVYYPAVLRSLKNIIESGVKAGIMVGMCGEAAADPLLEPLLISWGLEEFSMSAPSILRARKTISQWTKAECDELAEKALACNTAAEVKALLESAAR